MARLNAIVRHRAELCLAEVERMYALYATYYDAASRQRFGDDLAAKDWVIELREANDLRGFSTVALMHFGAFGARRALFSGDTIIDHRYWGEQSLAQMFCRLAGRVKAAQPRSPLYWFLISKGHRTYRYLSVFARSFFPSPHAATPPAEQSWLDELATRRFGAAYRPEHGVVRFASSHGHLKPQWAEVRDAVRERPEVRFFLERNPGWFAGEELCCLAELAESNLRSFAHKAFIEGLHDEPLLPGHLGERRALPRPAARGAGDAEAPSPRAAPA
jgi:hypothetical protein